MGGFEGGRAGRLEDAMSILARLTKERAQYGVGWHGEASARRGAGYEKSDVPKQRKAALMMFPESAESVSLMGASADALTYDTLAREGFNRNALIYAALAYKGRSFRKLPLRAYRGDPEHYELLPPDHPLARLCDRPNEYESWAEFIEKSDIYLNIAGSAFLYLDRDGGVRGVPRALYSLRPDRMVIVPKSPYGIKGYLYIPQGSSVGNGIPMLPQDVIHVKFPNPLDDYEGVGRGLSPLVAAAGAADVDNAVTSFLNDFFKHGAVVQGILSYEIELDERDIPYIKEEWRRQHGGYANWNDITVLGNGAKYERIALTFDEMGFGGIDERNEARITGPLGVPPILLFTRFGMSRSTLANYEQALKQFWQDTAVPESLLFQVELYNYLRSDDGGWVAFDYSDVSVLQEDISAKVQAWQVLVDRGIPKNVAAEVVGLSLPELPDDGTGYMPMSLVPIFGSGAEGGLPGPTPQEEEAVRVEEERAQGRAEQSSEEANERSAGPNKASIKSGKRFIGIAR